MSGSTASEFEKLTAAIRTAVKEEVGKAVKEEVEGLRAEVRAGFGTTYVPIDVIWKKKEIPVKDAAKKLRELRAKDLEVLEIYKVADGRELPRNVPKLDRDSPPFSDMCMFPGTPYQTSMAHVVPYDPICSLTWGEAIALVTGKAGSNMFASKNLRDFVRGNMEDKTNPFKVWAWNYLQLPYGHDEYFDNFKKGKAVVITPIWDPNNRWEPGTPYKLLVAATPEGYKWLLGITPLAQDPTEFRWFGEATPEEYKTATDFLQLVVSALGDLLIQSEVMDVVEQAYNSTDAAGSKAFYATIRNALEKEHGLLSDIIEGAFCDDNRSKRSNASSNSSFPNTLVGKLISLMQERKRMKRLGKERETGDPMIYAPTIVEGLNGQLLLPGNGKILTIDLETFFEENPLLIPDPYPVALKAGMNISTFYETPLLAGSNGMAEDYSVDDQGSMGSYHSVSETLTGEPGDGMMGEEVQNE
mmetsp:Transcript_22042/g.38831  ORF Transcript_22042/g.38831 Transcript_22042/m.38831 type:complete len:471 (-) Transcript_22042:355-1767(-)